VLQPEESRSKTTLIAVSGRVVEGHRVASGQAERSPYPAGSIALQVPHFQVRGLDLSRFYPATLNVEIAARRFVMKNPAYRFEQVRWFLPNLPEDFSFSRCQVGVRDRLCDGWVYYPHPDTKPAHWQAPNIIEVITSWLDGITYGDAVTLHLDPLEIDILD
jgi:hypothetical protein